MGKNIPAKWGPGLSKISSLKSDDAWTVTKIKLKLNSKQYQVTYPENRH